MHGDIKTKEIKFIQKKVQIFHYYTITALGIFCKVGSNVPTMQNIHSAVVL